MWHILKNENIASVYKIVIHRSEVLVRQIEENDPQILFNNASWSLRI